MTPKAPKAKVLLVDDEPSILDGLSRTLRGHFEVRTATSARDALAVLEAERDVAVIMTDMRMPVMNGTAFLARARPLAPDAVRLLLTGQADMEDAIGAINEGHIFRFLKKPCAPDLLRSTLADAAEQHRLVTAERELLEQTLRGSVKALSDTLALANPTVFGSAVRVKRLASDLAARVGGVEVWQVEVAAMLSQLGAVTLPPGVFERRTTRDRLSQAELTMLDRVPAVTDSLLASIPRLDDVRAILRASRAACGPDAPRGAHILRAATELEAYESAKMTPFAALQEMRHSKTHDAELLAVLATMRAATETHAKELTFAFLREGMVLATDVLMKNGTMLVARGHEVTEGLLRRLENFHSSLAHDRFAVIADDDGEPLLRAAS